MDPETPVRPNTSSAVWPVLIAIPLLFVAFAIVLSLVNPPEERLTFRDTDDAMRMVQVLDLKDGADWYDLTQRRLNPPEGVPMHWSRLPDLPLLSVLTLTEPLLGRTAAVNLTATLIPPLLWVGFFAAFVWAVMPLVERSVWPMAGMVCLALLAPHGYFMPLRIDHHGWQLLLAMIGAGALIRAALGSGKSVTPALIPAGVAGALGLWIGAEAIPPIALLASGLTLLWLTRGDRAWTLVLYGAVLTGGVLLIYPLALERAAWGQTACDAFSAVSLGLAAAVLAFGLGLLILEWRLGPRLTGLRPRLLSAGLLGGALLLMLWALFPECARGPYGALSPEALALVDQVVEAQPMSAVIADHPRTAALFMVLPLAALALVLWRLLTVERAERWLWWTLLLLVLGGMTLQFWQLRTSALANAYAGLVLAWWAGDWARRASASRHRLARVGLTALPLLVILGLPILAPTLVESATGKSDGLAGHTCDLSSVIPVLNGPELTASGPALIAAHTNVGPALLLRTPHQVLAAPYHRNTGGLRANTDIFGPDEALSRRVIAERGVDLLYVCGEPKPEQPPQPTPEPAPEATDPTHPTLYQRLQTGVAPEWLEPIPIPDAQPGEALYRVR